MGKSSLSLLVLLLIYVTSASAQSGKNTERVITELARLLKAYTGQSVSFDVKYKYSNEHTPGEVIDSIQGKMEMAGNSYRCELENTATISNERYNIVLFKEDKIMYLSKNKDKRTGESPAQLIQSILDQSGVKDAHISNFERSKKIVIEFENDAPCKKMEISIDTITYRLTAMRHIVKTALLTESPASFDATEHPEYDTYALVESLFYNYQAITPDKSRFDEHVFFYQEGDELKATTAFKDYKLFIGTPNL